MKKLKIKIFSIIFSLLTLFTLLIFITITTGNYMDKKNSISGILNKFSRNIELKLLPGKIEISREVRKVYLDFNIYTIVLDNSGEYIGIINHTNDENYDEDYVKKIAFDIIRNHKKNFYVGNLYVDRYAYFFTPDNMLIIMDNTKLNKTLISQLISNIIIFSLCEVLIFIITCLITKWITEPVKKSFEKQKIFVADASHELKTPLSVMIASADAYFNDKDDKWVYNMKNESERMIKLVTELLDLAKTEKEQDIVMQEGNLSDIVEGSILTFESLFYDKKIKLKYNIDPDIKILCNEDLMVELMGILIDNAIKYCSKNGKVVVDLSKKNKQIILEVKNTGAPIKKEDEERIFERFYKSDTSRNRNSNNYGLGLAIAKNIVEQHNGDISVHSNNGYTIFKVILNQK